MISAKCSVNVVTVRTDQNSRLHLWQDADPVIPDTDSNELQPIKRLRPLAVETALADVGKTVVDR
jgi:hypothetical protein